MDERSPVFGRLLAFILSVELYVDLIKKSSYRAFNAIYGEVGRLASHDVVIELKTCHPWAEEVGGQEGPGPPSNTSEGAIHVIGPSWKMLNQPLISPLTLAMTENY